MTSFDSRNKFQISEINIMYTILDTTEQTDWNCSTWNHFETTDLTYTIPKFSIVVT